MSASQDTPRRVVVDVPLVETTDDEGEPVRRPRYVDRLDRLPGTEWHVAEWVDRDRGLVRVVMIDSEATLTRLTDTVRTERGDDSIREERTLEEYPALRTRAARDTRDRERTDRETRR